MIYNFSLAIRLRVKRSRETKMTTKEVLESFLKEDKETRVSIRDYDGSETKMFPNMSKKLLYCLICSSGFGTS